MNQNAVIMKAVKLFLTLYRTNIAFDNAFDIIVKSNSTVSVLALILKKMKI
jgi:hypothetical protein